jgi:hypothetical protein
MEWFPHHIREEEKGEVERQSLPLVGPKIEKRGTTAETVRHMSAVVKEKQEEMIELKREEEEENIEQDWEEPMELLQTKPEHDWSAIIEKCLMQDFPQSVQELTQESILEKGRENGSSNSEQGTKMSLHELNKLIESESQMEKNLQDWRVEELDQDPMEWEEADSNRRQTWTTSRNNIWDSVDQAEFKAILG